MMFFAGNAAVCQYAADCHDRSLPFTGYAAGAVLLVGVLIVVAGALLRRSPER